MTIGCGRKMSHRMRQPDDRGIGSGGITDGGQCIGERLVERSQLGGGLSARLLRVDGRNSLVADTDGGDGAGRCILLRVDDGCAGQRSLRNIATVGEARGAHGIELERTILRISDDHDLDGVVRFGERGIGGLRKQLETPGSK